MKRLIVQRLCHDARRPSERSYCSRPFRLRILIRDRPKFGFGFGYGAETGDIFSFDYSHNREARFRPTFAYGRNYDKVSA